MNRADRRERRRRIIRVPPGKDPRMCVGGQGHRRASSFDHPMIRPSKSSGQGPANRIGHIPVGSDGARGKLVFRTGGEGPVAQRVGRSLVIVSQPQLSCALLAASDERGNDTHATGQYSASRFERSTPRQSARGLSATASGCPPEVASPVSSSPNTGRPVTDLHCPP
jgi:hypothetical protein